MDAKELDKDYTYEDYMSWGEGERIEIMDGEAVMMAPPSRVHQEISGEIFRQLANFLKDKPCKVFPAPFGVKLEKRHGRDTVVEPDIVVVCDHSKLDEHGCKGAPDLVVEILSPSTAGYDRLVKFNKYLQAGVREYWIVDPDTKMVSVNVLKDGEYVARAYGKEDTAPVSVLEGCEISLSDVFAE